MGVVNATPDSFSDAFPSVTAAVEHGLALLAEGADLLDVGGESTRPGADRVDEDEERRRVLPVVKALVADGAVAADCLDLGAVLVNDVSGGLADPAMLPMLAGTGAPCVLMHWRGHSASMQARASYDEVVTDVRRELSDRLAAALEAGVDADSVVLDPGLGFAKTAAHNWALIAGLESLAELGRPLLVGASRKAFLGELLDGREAAGREAATVAVTTLAARAGAWGVRVHDVRSSADAVRVVAAVGRA